MKMLVATDSWYSHHPIAVSHDDNALFKCWNEYVKENNLEFIPDIECNTEEELRKAEEDWEGEWLDDGECYHPEIMDIKEV